MESPSHAGPIPLPYDAEVSTATVKGMTLLCPRSIASGSVLQFDLLLGARPLPVMARVVECRGTGDSRKHALDLEFLAMAQVDRDVLADFLQAVGPGALRLREHRED